MKPFAKYILLILSSVLFSGCVLTDEFKQQLFDEGTEKNNLLKQNKKFEKLSADVEEIKELTPNLVRIIKMEEDLAYLLDSMKKQDNSQAKRMPNFSEELSNKSPATLASSLVSVVENKQFNDLSSPTNSISSSDSGVQLGQAAPMMEVSNIDEKFSGNERFVATEMKKPANQLLPAKNINLTNDNKFSSLNTAGSAIDANSILSTNAQSRDCAGLQGLDGNLSLHLASYSTMKSAEQGWQSLLDKYKNSLCGLRPVIANVTVKGKQYKSLRVGPLNDEKVVAALCQEIRAQGDYCNKSQYTGVPL